MIVQRQEVHLLVLVLVVSFFSSATHGQQARRLGERVIAAQDIPLTNFSCVGRNPGYYADVETGCQVYHMCTDGGQQFSYKCPNTTLFQQRMLICAHWYQVNCSRSEQDYNANLLIGQRDKPFVDESEHISIYFNNDKDFHPLKNPDDLQRLGTNGNGGGRVHTHQYKQSTLPVTIGIPKRINMTNIVSHTTNNPLVVRSLQTTPSFSTTNNFVPFNTFFTTTPFPQTDNFEQDYDTTTTDYYDENIKNSYNNFINRFIPSENETDITPRAFTPTITTSPFNDNTVTHDDVQTTTFPPPTTFNFNLGDNNHKSTDVSENKQENLYNNFITRFIPYLNETNTNNDSFVHVEHKFLKRFNPDEVVPNENIPVNHFNQQQGFINHDTFINNQNFESFYSLTPPLQAPSVNLELPQEFEDADHMESNILELQFQDPRHAFFIPDSDNQNIPVENVSPITVSIPRQAIQQQLHPMLFINSASNICSRCHPSFIVNKSTCSPCVIIR